MFYKLVLCSFRKCSYAWLRLALSRLGIIQVNLASAFAAPELFILSLGLAHDWLRFGIAKTSFALHSPCTIIVYFYPLNTYIARCGFAEDWLRLGKAENKFSLCSHLAQSLRVFAGQKSTVR